MQKITKLIPGASAWVAAAQLADINLPREGLVTQIEVRANMAIAGALTATGSQDCTRRALEGLSIVGDGGKNYLSMVGGDTMGRMIALMNLLDTGVSGQHAEVIVGSVGFIQSFVFHPGSFPKNEYDLSAVIPAQDLATFAARIVCPAAAVTGAVAADAITAGAYSIIISEVIGVKPTPKGLMIPTGFAVSYPHDANWGGFGRKIQLPAGAWIRRIAILAQDNVGVRPVRVDNTIVDLRVELVKDNNNPIELNLEDLKSRCARRYGNVMSTQDQVLGAAGAEAGRLGYEGGAILPYGFFILDFRDMYDPVYGMNLIADPVSGYTYQTGDVQLGLTTANQAAGDDFILFFDTVQPLK